MSNGLGIPNRTARRIRRDVPTNLQANRGKSPRVPGGSFFSRGEWRYHNDLGVLDEGLPPDIDQSFSKEKSMKPFSGDYMSESYA